MKALILAAGYATRLYPLTKDYPKPLLALGSKPIINYIIEKISGLSSVSEIMVVTNSRFIGHFRRWAKGIKINKRVTLVDDLTRSLSDRRGAVGDMSFVIDKKRINDNLLVVGGDNIFEDSLKGFMSFAAAHRKNPVMGVYNVRSRSKARHYGVVRLNRANRVVGFREKPETPKSTFVAMCLYYFPKASLRLIKEYTSDKSHRYDATGSYINWLKDKLYVYAYIFQKRWYDIGNHRFYDEARKRFMGR